MKREEQQVMEAYEAPKVEVIEVEVERGFAGSTGVNDWNGNNLGNQETE